MPGDNDKKPKYKPGQHPNSRKNLIQKGQVLNPKGINRRPGIFSHVWDMLGEGVVDPNTNRKIPKAKAMARILGNCALRGPGTNLEGHTLSNSPNWRFAMQAILERTDPVPRETALFAVNVQAEHTTLAISFCERVRQAVGHADITSRDVLSTLESDTFGDDGSDGRGNGS